MTTRTRLLRTLLIAFLSESLAAGPALAQSVTGAPAQAPAPVPGLAGAGLGASANLGPSGIGLSNGPAALGSLTPSLGLPVSPSLLSAPAAAAVSQVSPLSSPLHNSVSPSAPPSAPAAAAVSQAPSSVSLPKSAPAAASVSQASPLPGPVSPSVPPSQTISRTISRTISQSQTPPAASLPELMKLADPAKAKDFSRMLEDLSARLPDLSRTNGADAKAGAEAEFLRRLGDREAASSLSSELSPAGKPLGRLSPRDAGLAPSPEGDEAELQAVEEVEARGWKPGVFRSPADKTPIRYKVRPGKDSKAVPMVFLGGLALAESFDSLFAVQDKPKGDQYFAWLRAHPPSPWTHTEDVFTADARDMARMIVTAARHSGSGAVSLALHSYAALVFQRMLQLGSDAEVARALSLLKGGKVYLLNTTTHYGNSEMLAGPQFGVMAKVIQSVVNYINAMDSYIASMKRAAELNPLLLPMVTAWDASWQLQRVNLLKLSSGESVRVMKEHLSEPWPAEVDHVRQRLIRALGRNGEDTGWQEALLRRTNSTSLLEFTKEDVDVLRRLGIRTEVVYSHDDQLVPWVSEKLLLGLLGIEAPDEVPPVGTVLQDESGLLRFRVVAGDHYFPLKQPRELQKTLDR